MYRRLSCFVSLHPPSSSSFLLPPFPLLLYESILFATASFPPALSLFTVFLRPPLHLSSLCLLCCPFTSKTRYFVCLLLRSPSPWGPSGSEERHSGASLSPELWTQHAVSVPPRRRVMATPGELTSIQDKGILSQCSLCSIDVIQRDVQEG